MVKVQSNTPKERLNESPNKEVNTKLQGVNCQVTTKKNKRTNRGNDGHSR